MSARTILNPASNQALAPLEGSSVYYNSNNLMLTAPGGAVISTSTMNVNGRLNCLSNISFGSANGFKIVNGTITTSQILSVDVLAYFTFNIDGSPFTAPPSIFLSATFIPTPESPFAYSGQLNLMTVGATTNTIEISAYPSIAVQAGVVISWMAIGL